jgi:hypothetical protein
LGVFREGGLAPPLRAVVRYDNIHV